MENFKYLSRNTVGVMVLIQERDADGELKFETSYNLRQDDCTNLLQIIKDYQDSLEDLYYNPRNKEELNNRFSKAVSSV